MAQVTAPPDPGENAQERKKSRRAPLILGGVGALVLGGAGFYAAYSGLVPAPNRAAQISAQPIAQDFAYIPIERLVVSLPAGRGARQLQFAGQIEVNAQSERDLQRLHPRFVDTIHTYLRAVDAQDLTDPAALIRLRAQILRRLQTIAGQGHVRDFLITEFILG